MSETPVHTYEESIVVEATPEVLYDLVSDIARTGEWSPVCTSCWWDDAEQAGKVGAWFTGHNELPDRTWETKSQIVAADQGKEFAWIVGGTFARWDFAFAPDGAGTRLTESWQFLPSGIAMFGEKYGDRATAEIDERIRQAHDGIPRTLSAIKKVAEASWPIGARGASRSDPSQDGALTGGIRQQPHRDIDDVGSRLQTRQLDDGRPLCEVDGAAYLCGPNPPAGDGRVEDESLRTHRR